MRFFEAKVMIPMILFYSLELWTYLTNTYYDGISATGSILEKSLSECCYMFYHWSFASQYLKTSILIPSFIRSKVVLLKMYDEKVKHEHAKVPLSEAYMDRHNMHDFTI